MKIIHGSECKLSIYYNETFTPIPYCTETLRSSDLVYSLDETVGDKKRVVNHKYGSEIAGCFVTRLTKDCIIPLFKIVTDPGCAFSIYMDRVK